MLSESLRDLVRRQRRAQRQAVAQPAQAPGAAAGRAPAAGHAGPGHAVGGAADARRRHGGGFVLLALRGQGRLVRRTAARHRRRGAARHAGPAGRRALAACQRPAQGVDDRASRRGHPSPAPRHLPRCTPRLGALHAVLAATACLWPAHRRRGLPRAGSAHARRAAQTAPPARGHRLATGVRHAGQRGAARPGADRPERPAHGARADAGVPAQHRLD